MMSRIGERLGLSPSADAGTDAPAGEGQSLILPLVVSVLTLTALALTLIWLNIERTKLAYSVRNLRREEAAGMELNAKLSVERDHLLSPRTLGRKAEALGLHAAKPGQIRRMEALPKEEIPK